MRYGYFDNDKKEYVIDRVDLPTSWTNYLGVEKMAAVVNHTAGGYLFYNSPEYHRITRFHANSVPMDRPGFYVYLRDNEDGDYWSCSWQPTGGNKDEYLTRHGLSYSVYECDHNGLHSEQRMTIPIGDNVLLWDVSIRNDSDRDRDISVFSYCEFSFHHVMIDNINFQMSLYCAGSSYDKGVIEEDLFYEEEGYQYMTSDFEPDGYDCVRDEFLGRYGTESAPKAIKTGRCSGSSELGGNHCGVLMKKLNIPAGKSVRLIYMLGEGDREEGLRLKDKYSSHATVDLAYKELADFWNEKCERMHIDTPSEAMNTMINIWTLYQSEINVMFSRFASFIEVGGRVGLGYRDTAQDSMTIPHSNPDKCRERLVQLLKGLTTEGYGLHLFQPEWFEDDKGKKPFNSPTVIPKPDKGSIIHGLSDACSDDALWLIPSITGYIKETGDTAFADMLLPYADTYVNGEELNESVYDHMKRILDFSDREIGMTGICKGLRADWNDCLNLGGGESALVSFLHYRAIREFVGLAIYLNKEDDVIHYSKMADKVKKVCNEELWDGEWYIRGITASGRKIGCREDKEGKVHLESNAWAVLSGVADGERADKTLKTMDEYLYTPYGLLLNTPSYTEPDDEIGFVTRVYPGLKENGAVFSHPNPWAQAAACIMGRGDLAMKWYDALCPYNQNDMIEVRESEPYSYCQFIVGKDHTAYGRARHPFMTGSGGWSYYTATEYILGIRPDYDRLTIDPCIPADWKDFSVQRTWRGAIYDIRVHNDRGVMRGVDHIMVDGDKADSVGVFRQGTRHTVDVYMG